MIQRGLVDPANTTGSGQLPPAHEVTFPFDRAHAPPELDPGETVAVLATFDGSAETATRVVAADAIVLAFSADEDSLGSNRGRLTVSVSDPAEAIALAHVAHVADITVIRATQADDELPGTYSVDRLGIEEGLGGN